MQERHTPIERVPHLGFKQINLWKIYKAVEKLGAYELVTGRRLWKNVYDELGGSPGSTSAATCTRRHYERLVLPYVRHLKGEDDKPLPPSKPRKQYKMVKEPQADDGATERPRTAKEERQVDQVTAGRTPTDAAGLAQLPSPELPSTERPHPATAPALPLGGAGGCPEAYKRVLSSVCGKGWHGVMSPLAKKKLLAQASQAEALQCPEGGGCRGTGAPGGERHGSPGARRVEGPRSPGQEGQQAPSGSLRAQAPAAPCPPAPSLAGCFRACPTAVLRPISQHPRDFFSGLKEGVSPGPPSKDEGPPAGGSRLVWGGDAGRPSAFHRGGSRRGSPYPKPKACWVSPTAHSPAPPPSCPGAPGLGVEEEGFAHGGKKLGALSPFVEEVAAEERGARLGGPGPTCLLAPAPRGACRGAVLRCPLDFAHPPGPLKAALPLGPLVIPPFPAHFLAAAAPAPPGLVPCPPASLGGALRHRLCPASAAWHLPPAAYAAPHFFHLNTKL
nr:AT-rich interactive domain-containing protein 5A isoform X2 [Dasypus novemcinctus]